MAYLCSSKRRYNSIWRAPLTGSSGGMISSTSLHSSCIGSWHASRLSPAPPLHKPVGVMLYPFSPGQSRNTSVLVILGSLSAMVVSHLDSQWNGSMLTQHASRRQQLTRARFHMTSRSACRVCVTVYWIIRNTNYQLQKVWILTRAVGVAVTIRLAGFHEKVGSIHVQHAWVYVTLVAQSSLKSEFFAAYFTCAWNKR